MRVERQDLRERTKAFALRVIHLVGKLPRTNVAKVIGNQVLRSGTSVGAQYHEACRSRTDAELISKLSSTLQELEETEYWLDLLIEGGVVPRERLQPLHDETRELIAIFVTSIKKLKISRRS